MESKVVNRKVAVAVCRPHPKNYNRHSQEQIGDLRASLRRFGQVRSIVVQAEVEGEGFVLVAGEGVWRAAQLEGLKKLRADVIPADWDQVRVAAYMAADNELARQASPDEAQLAALVAEIEREAGEEMARLAAGAEARLQELMAMANVAEPAEDPGPQMDRAAELQNKWKVKRGQIWEIPSQSVPGRCHRVMCGDSTDKDNVKILMSKKWAEMCFTDPPYGVDYQGHDNPRWSQAHSPMPGDALPADQLIIFWQSAFSIWAEFIRGDLYSAAPSGPPNMLLAEALGKSPFEHHQWLIWIKQQLVLGRSHYHYRHEHIWYGWKKNSKSSWQGKRDQDSVWEIDRPLVSPEHPTMKPTALIVKAIKNSSTPGQIVADLFLGSGTTIVACEQTGRIGYGMEIEPKYVAVTLERLAGMGLEPRLAES